MIREFDFVPVDSSMIVGVFHDGSDLLVKFKNLSVYRYREVSESVYDQLLELPSVGKAFNQMIKGQYQEEQIR